MEPKTPDYFTILLPVVTLMLGVILNAAIEYVRDGRTSKREQKARAVRREEEIAAKRIEFQRETLLELQNAVNEMGRQTAKLHIHDLQHFRNEGTWQEANLPHDIDEAQRAAVSWLSVLYVRVLDREVKLLIDRFRSDTDGTLKNSDALGSAKAFENMQTTFIHLNAKIGENLLNLDNALMNLVKD